MCNVDRLLKERGSVKKKGEGGSEPISDSAASISSAKGSDEENGSDPTSPELEEALYQSLLEDSVADEVLVKRVRSLFDSATSLTAKESLLLSLRWARATFHCIICCFFGSDESCWLKLHASLATARSVLYERIFS